MLFFISEKQPALNRAQTLPPQTVTCNISAIMRTANSAGSEAQEQYSSEDDNGDFPTTEINTEKKQDDLGISKQIKSC